MGRENEWRVPVGLAASWAASALLVWGCSSFDPCRQAEALRKTSGDGIVDFAVVQRDCGATTAVSTSVFVVPSGGRTQKARPIFEADHVEGLEVSWESPKHLSIRYEQARIFRFTNFWLSRDIEDFRYVVSIREQQSTRSPMD